MSGDYRWVYKICFSLMKAARADLQAAVRSSSVINLEFYQTDLCEATKARESSVGLPQSWRRGAYKVLQGRRTLTSSSESQAQTSFHN